MEVDADMAEEARRRRRTRMARRRRAITLIKSNNPHLAGGEKSKAHVPHVIYMQKKCHVISNMDGWIDRWMDR